MKNHYLIWGILLMVLPATAQIGIGTTSPNSTLDVRGAMSLNYRSFTGNTIISNIDNTLVFTGSSNATATLPDASTCTGRIYRIKNASTASIIPVLTITAASGQNIDGCSGGWLLDNANEAVTILSNGAGWYVSSQNSSDSLITNWSIEGNGVSSEKRIGTTSNYSLPFITNNIERMRLTGTGRLGIGVNNPVTEAHIVGAGAVTGITNRYCCRCGIHCLSCPELLLNNDLKVQVKN